MEKEFESIADELFKKQPEIEVKQNILDASNRDPDRYAESYKMAKQNNIPVETVENNFDKIKKRTRFDNFNNEFENYFNNNPKTLDFLKDKDNAILAYDDIDSLGFLEKSFTNHLANATFDIISYSPSEIWSFAKQGFRQGVAINKLGRLAYEQSTGQTDFKVSQEQINNLQEMLADDPGREGFVRGFIYPGAKILGQVAESSKRAFYAGAGAGTIAALAGQAGPQIAFPEEIITVPTAFTAGVTASLAADTYMIEAGNTYLTLNELEQKKGQKIDPFVKNGAASFVGLVNAGLEMVGIKYVSAPLRSAMKKYFIQEGSDILIDKTKSEAIKKFGTEYIKALGAETSTEVMQEVTSALAEQLAGKVSYEDFQGATFQENVDRMLSVATETMRGMAVIGLIGPGVNLHIDYARARKAQANKEFMLFLGDETKKSKLYKRAPEKFRDFISQIKGSVNEVYIDAGQFETYFQSKNLDPIEIARQLGVENSFNEARQLGSDIQIPLENYAQKLAATEYHQDLINYIKLQPTDMTVEQSQAIIDKGISKIIEEESSLAQQVEEKRIQKERPAENVFNEVKQQLIQIGRSPDIADKEATLWKSFFGTLQEKTGVDAYSLYKGQNIQIKREIPELLKEKGREDVALDKLREYKGLIKTGTFGKSLNDFIIEQGGINQNDEMISEINTNISKDIIKENGQTLDDLTLSAWENGYFEGFKNKPTVEDLITKINQELGGQLQYSIDKLNVEDIKTLEGLNQFLNDVGIDIASMTNKEVKDFVNNYQGKPQGKVKQFFQKITGKNKVDTNSKAFKDWFGDSKVVDSKGNPLIVYHGTNQNFEEFAKTSEFGTKGVQLGEGFYFATKKETAKIFGKNIIPVYLNIKNLFNSDSKNSIPEAYFKINKKVPDNIENLLKIGATNTAFRAMLKEDKNILNKAKYDGIIGTSEFGGEEIVVFEPTQVKSVKNQGTFSSENANIYLQDTGDKRGAFIKADGEKVIKLFEQADLSTFLHESGHFFFEVMADTAQQQNAPREIINDYNTILKFLEVDSRENVGTKQHEKFARAFEAYLYEGKAPSIELQSVFTRFKNWLINVYKNIKNLDVTISDELRDVFNRMLATQEEIQNAEQLNNMTPLFTQENSGMNYQEYQEYLKSAQKATITSEEELLKRTMNEIKREKIQWYKDEKTKIKARIEKEVMEKPENQALYYLQNGNLYEGELPDDMRNLKLDRKIIEDVYGKETLSQLPKGIYKKGGVSPEIIADIFGFDSNDAVIKSLTNTKTLATTIEELANTELKNKYGDMFSDASIKDEALTAIYNDERANFLSIELKVLGKKTGQNITSLKEISKGAAQRILSEVLVKDLRPAKYQVAETKAARLAQKAVSEGSFAEAMNQKRKQLLNHYLAREGKKIEEGIDKGLKYLKKFDRKSIRQKIGKAGFTYLDQIDGLLENYELKKQTTLRRIKSRESLVSFIQSEKDKGSPINIAQEIIDQASVISYKQVSTDKFFGLVDSVKNIEHLANFKNKLIINKQVREIRDIANEISSKAEGNLKPRKLVLNPERTNEQRKSFIRGLGGAVLKIQTYIEKLDLGQKVGSVYQYLKAPIDEASNIKAERMVKETEKFAEIMNKYYGKDNKSIKDKVRNLISPVENLTSNKSKVYIQSINESLTLEERVTVALNVGNKDNKTKLMHGRRWNETQINDILNTLEKRDWDFVQSIWDYLDSFWNESSALERELSGIAAPKVKPMMVSTKHGTYTGGYFPLKYSDSQISEAQYFQDMRGGGFNATNVSRKAQKERVTGVRRRVNLSGLGTINSHISEIVNSITMGRAVHNVDKLLRNRRIKETIETYINPEAYIDFGLWLKDVAATGTTSNDAMTRLARNLRSSTAIGAMGFKLSTAFIQLSGFSHSIVEIGPKNILTGLMSMFTDGKPWEVMKQVQDKSLFMRDRSRTFNRDVNDVIKSFRGDKLSSNLVKIYFYPIAKMQQLVDIPTWIGAYKSALKEGKTENQAIQAGDIAVENSQGTGLIKGLSPIERGTLSSTNRFNEWIKLFTTFYSYFNTKLNLAVRETQNTNFKSPKQVLTLATNYLTLFWLEAIVGELLLGKIPDFDDDDPVEKFASYSGKLALSQMAGSLPFAREVAAKMQGFDAAPGGIRGLSDVARGIKTIKDLAVDLYNQDEIDGYKATESLLMLGNVLSPIKIPTGQVNVALDAIKKQQGGEDIEFYNYFFKDYKK